jgi:hypothetical protein
VPLPCSIHQINVGGAYPRPLVRLPDDVGDRLGARCGGVPGVAVHAHAAHRGQPLPTGSGALHDDRDGTLAHQHAPAGLVQRPQRVRHQVLDPVEHAERALGDRIGAGHDNRVLLPRLDQVGRQAQRAQRGRARVGERVGAPAAEPLGQRTAEVQVRQGQRLPVSPPQLDRPLFTHGRADQHREIGARGGQTGVGQCRVDDLA